MEELENTKTLLFRDLNKCRGLKNDQRWYKKDNYFLSRIHIKVTFQSSQEKTALNNATAVISMIFSMIGFICRPNYFFSKLSTVLSYFKTFNRHGV